MAVPAYTNDLTTIVDFDGTPSSPAVAEPTGAWAAGRSPSITTDYPIQGSNHCDLVMNATGKAGALCSNGASFTWTSGDYLFGWIIWTAPGAIAERTAGGLAMLCGSSISDYKVFYVGGKSFGLYPYGGWQNFAVDPTMTYSEVFGTTPTAFNIVGGGANVLTAVSKGSPLGFDVFRYGRGTFRIAGGSSGDGYATFTGMATANDALAARWGLFQGIQGGYKYKGLMHFGYGALTEFIDGNKSIVIDEMIFVQSTFNRIEFHNASSVINWNNISFNSIATVSPGALEVIDDCDLTFAGCTFQNMDTFIFKSLSKVTNSIFVKCKLITSGGGHFTGTKVLQSSVAADASAFQWNVATNPDGYLDNMEFVKGALAHHAINFGTSAPASITLRGISFTGFNAADGQNDSVLYIARTDVPITIQCVECSGTVSYKKAGSNDVTITQGALTKITVRDFDTNAPIQYARVSLEAADATGNLNYQESVSIVSSGTTATVTHTGHGLADGDWVRIRGCTQSEYNIVAQITYIGIDNYSYQLKFATSSPAGDSPNSTTVLFNHESDSNGVVSEQRSWTLDQPVIGRVRQATNYPYYKTTPITETINKTIGLNINVLLIKDL